MVRTLLLDFSRTLILPKEINYSGKLNDLYRSIISNKDYSFYNHFVLNEELLDFIKLLKNKYVLALYTTDIIQTDPAIKPILDEIFQYVFAANNLRINKEDPDGYLLISKTLGNKPEEILFIDDQLSNLEAAQQIGFQTIQFISNKQLFNRLRKITPIPW